MLNLDSEEEGIFTVSCAGGARANLSLPVERRAVYGPCVKLTVEGLQGGHSGVEIHKKRANANKVMGEFLSRVQQLIPVCITKLQGGAKDNAIPRSCEVTLVALGMYIERINDIAEQLQKEIREQYDEPEAIVRGDDVDAPENVVGHNARQRKEKCAQHAERYPLLANGGIFIGFHKDASVSVDCGFIIAQGRSFVKKNETKDGEEPKTCRRNNR